MNIFVAKLATRVVDDNLRVLFEQYGHVENAKVIMDRDTGNSKGFGFIEMPNENEALEAIKALNNFSFIGRNIVVKRAESHDKSNSNNSRQHTSAQPQNNSDKKRNTSNQRSYSKTTNSSENARPSRRSVVRNNPNSRDTDSNNRW